MRGKPAAWIAWRYLVSKKSHSAVGAISVVSICGMAVATAAIICVLSVFNGFKEVIAERLDTLSPDIMVTPAKGKVFENADSLASVLSGIKGVAIATPTLTDNALTICDSREMPITLKGVNISEYRKITSLDSLIIDRESAAISTDIPKTEAILSIGTAAGISATPGTMMPSLTRYFMPVFAGDLLVKKTMPAGCSTGWYLMANNICMMM